MTRLSARRIDRRVLAFAMSLTACSLIVAAGVASCGGTCAEAREARDRDPAWQSGSLSALGTAYVGREVAREAASAWIANADEDIMAVLEGLPTVRALVRAGVTLRIDVLEAHFAEVANGTGPEFVFDVLAEGAVDPAGGGFRGLGRVASIRLVLQVRAPLYVERADHGPDEVRARIADMRVSVREAALGPLQAGFDRSTLIDGLQERLLSERSDIVVATIAPIVLDSLTLRIRLLEARHWSSDHVALDFEFADVSAPAGAGPAELPDSAPTDAVVVALSESAALALGDHGLRVRADRGFSARGRPGGPYTARLRALALDSGSLEVTIEGLRCERLCAVAELRIAATSEMGDDGPKFHVESTNIMSSSLPRWMVRTAMPSARALSDRATELTREVLTAAVVDVPLVEDRVLRFESIAVSEDAVIGVGRLHPTGPQSRR